MRKGHAGFLLSSLLLLLLLFLWPREKKRKQVVERREIPGASRPTASSIRAVVGLRGGMSLVKRMLGWGGRTTANADLTVDMAQGGRERKE